MTHAREEKSSAAEERSVLKALAAVGAASLAVRALRRRAHNEPEVADADLGASEARLRALMRDRFRGVPLVVVANREPYTHSFDGDAVRVSTAAGGLVTALEPLLRATGGTWVAHGAGTADAATVDDRHCVAVPPDLKEYTLRRVFLTAEEEAHYYSGFSNEALWPLCHNAFTKPVFRRADWIAYQQVNRRFADAALETSKGLILLQDYHFALAARFIRDVDAKQTIGSFWHIPWPSAEIFCICPWSEALLDGLLALDVLAFHTRPYCLNFLDTAERTLDCRVNRQKMTVEYRGHMTRVRAVPISIPYPARDSDACADVSHLRQQLGIGEKVHVSIAVDRVDYTKGIIERLRAIDALLEKAPDLAGRYLLIQIAAPSRGSVAAYRDLEQAIRNEVDRVNERWATAEWKPVKLIMETLSRAEVLPYYQLADSALVTPLHDGMNLVAKEYAATCGRGRGVLILSQFAGAAEELRTALQVNPYDAEGVAEAIRTAIDMPRGEREWRIAGLHAALKRNTIFDWAAKLLLELAESTAKQKERESYGKRDRAVDGPLFGSVARA